MPAVVRLGDMCTGHQGFPPRPSDSASPDVFINNIPAVRVGDHWVPHSAGRSTHDGVQSIGSATVFVNNMPLARVGDEISCGSYNAQGSPNVFSG